MAECAYCKAETQLYDRDVPICTKCAEERDGIPRKPPTSQQYIRATLLQEVLQATARTNQAAQDLTAVIGQPGGLPPADGIQGIQRASRNLAAARKELMRAHSRLNDYHARGIVPEDLQRSG
jgi:hypothetical protein